MTTDRSIEILRCMASGVDPITGEILQASHLCNYSEVIRALYAAVEALSQTCADARPPARKNGKLNAGRPWTNEDLDDLKRMYQSNQPMDAICQKLQRRENGITRQLAYLGLIESEKQPRKKPVPGLERAGLPWIQEEDVHLRELYLQKLPISQIAAQMQRSEYSIYCRMEKLELFGTEYGYPEEEELPAWNTAEQRALREMFLAGKDVTEIAASLKRSPVNIRARLHYMGLSNETAAPVAKETD